MKSLSELVLEKRWPDDGEVVQWNRGAGLKDLCDDVFGWKDPENFIADLGVARGVSTQIFSNYGKVLGVDRSLWPEALELRGHLDITLMEEDTLEAAQFLRGRQTFNLVYHDSDHSEEFLTQEIKAWLPLVRKGGFVAGHDYGEAFPGVMRAVIKIFGGPYRVYQDSSWLVRL